MNRSEDNIMTTVTIGLASRSAIATRFVAAMNGEPQGAHIAFDTPELLFQVLTRDRWILIKTMIGKGPLSVHEISQRLDRETTSVQDDVRALLDTGVFEKSPDGSIVFPYDAVHVDFMITAEK